MAANLRSSLARGEMYNFIAAVKSSKGSVEENTKLKHSFNLYIRNALQDYSPSLGDNKDLKCFIYAAKIKHDISNSDIYYIETARSTAIGAVMGVILCGAVPTAICNLFELSRFTLTVIFSVGALIGGRFGFYAGLDLAYYDIEQEVSWHEIMKCGHEISPVEVSGALPAEEMI